MNKSAIQRFAVKARTDLIEQVKGRMANYGIDGVTQPDKSLISFNGIPFTADEKSKRIALINEIEKLDYENVAEKVAYTWFNRFIALRFMEVNGYLPTRMRILSNRNNEYKPEILNNLTTVRNLPGLDLTVVNQYTTANDNEGLYKYVLVTQCNALHYLLPKMFEEIGGYTELLLPFPILSDNSIIANMLREIPEDDFKGDVQIIGWLYQYYISKHKDEVFADLKKNIKITKENIPAATQLFTPDWIVRYMVENSLGRIAVEKLGLNPVTMGWKYYIEETEQTEEVQEQLKILTNEEKFKLEELKLIDPCMGSGHILVYAFDVLYQIYENQSYTPQEAVESILKYNLYGLDIDERACQLAYFSIMMKAIAKDSQFLTRKIEPQVYCPKGYKDGEEYGSLIFVDALEDEPEKVTVDSNEQVQMSELTYEEKMNKWNFRRLLDKKYDVVITNPPYMGSKGMNSKLADFVKKYYPESKSDMSTAFMEKTLFMCKPTGYMSMINIPSWMFLSSYEKLRIKLILNTTFSTMLHFGRGVFGSDFGSVAFVINNTHIKNYNGTYRRLFEKQVTVDSLEQKEKWFFEGFGFYINCQNNFSKIPGNPIAYWVSDNILDIFDKPILLGTIANSKQGLATADNNSFLRLWSEVSKDKISFDSIDTKHSVITKAKWFPYNKGGDFRKWYGNNDWVVNWENDGNLIRNFKNSSGKLRSRPQNTEFYFKECFSWSLVTSSVAAFRYKPKGHIFDVAGMSCFTDNNLKYLLALCNTKVVMEILKILAPTINFQCGDIANIPVIVDSSQITTIETLSQQNIDLSKKDWDSFEISWDFEQHPFIQDTDLILTAYNNWDTECTDRFNNLKANEIKLNEIFIDIYDLSSELTPDVDDKDVTVRKADLTRDVKSFISYAVGCMFGRYSLDDTGLIFAGGDFDATLYKKITPVDSNVIMICDDDYFADDIVARFIDFVKVIYGDAKLEDNLQFISSALGGKTSAREVLRDYFVNDFYNDHIDIYKGKQGSKIIRLPIYWQLDSGKNNGFKALFYMHRYEVDLLASVRTDFVHPLQDKYDAEMSSIDSQIADPSTTTAEKTKLNSQKKKLSDKINEISEFEENIHHIADQKITFDLDDGVTHNYKLFPEVLTKLK